MKAVQRGIEDDNTTEDRLYADRALLHGLVPQLQLPAVFVMPVFVEINQKIEPSFKPETIEHVEIGEDAKVSAWLRFVQSSSLIIWIGDETRDPGQVFEETEESLAVEFGEEAARETG